MDVQNSFLGARDVGRGTEQTLWAQGITRWDAFHPDCQGIGPTREATIREFIDGGRRAIGADDVTYFADRFPSREHWRLYETFESRTCFFDIETTGLSEHHNVVTTVTLSRDGQTRTLVRGDDLTTASLREAFDGVDLLVTFNGARFDIPFLEAHFDIDLDRPHIDLMPTCRQVGLDGGLAAVEESLGIERDLPDIDGRDAVRLWQEHERGVDGALDRLIAYNREDTVNMRSVLERTIDRLDTQLLPPEPDL